jgi:predicted membrane channel-forming protein YqfA (hemolysin III family)
MNTRSRTRANSIGKTKSSTISTIKQQQKHVVSVSKKYVRNGRYENLDDWQKGNPSIHGGYRRNMKPMDIFWSIFHLHNETTNFWTHFLGFFMMLWLLRHALTTWLVDAPTTDKILFACYALGQASQMLFSAIFHIAKCYGPRVFKWTARFDYIGIAITIATSHFQPIYYVNFLSNFNSIQYSFVKTKIDYV